MIMSARWLSQLTLFVALALTSSALAQTSAIESARTLPAGASVTVTGVAISGTGDFSPNDNGFAIADRGAGIYVADSLTLDIEVGQTVRVSGVIGSTFGGVLAILPSSIEPVGVARPPSPRPVKTGGIGESTEGRLVKIRGTIVGPLVDDAPYGVHFEVDDGSGAIVVFVTAGTGIDTSTLAPGQRVQVEGISAQFGDHYEVDPVAQDDIRIVPSCSPH